MTNIYIIGINHKTAPIAVREKFYLTATEQDFFLSELKSNPSIIEALVLCTCNRTEVYVNVIDGFVPAPAIFELFERIKKERYPAEYKDSFYILREQKAVEHLLRVAAGLDSLVLGEKQILGQVKQAIERGRTHAIFEKRFNILADYALRTGKKAQAETQIGFGGSSVSWAAIVKAEEVLGTLDDKSILLIGAGKMSKLAVGQIQNRGFQKLYLMNRTEANAQSLAEKYGGEVVGLCDIKEILEKIDICICSAGAPHYILEKPTIEKIMDVRKAKQLVLIDISMPRNIDPLVNEIDGVQLYEIDDLEKVVDSTMRVRNSAIVHVEEIIQDKLADYARRIRSGSQPIRETSFS